MNLDRRNIEKILTIGSFFILLYLGLQNMNVVVSFFSWLMYVLMPFIIAVCCTFFLNVPMTAIEKHLFCKKDGTPINPTLDKLRRPISLILSILLFASIIAAFLIIIIPEIGKSIASIAQAVPGTIQHIREWLDDLSTKNEYIGNFLGNMKIDWDFFNNYITNFLTNDAATVVTSTMGMVQQVFNFAINFLLGFVLSVYTLLRKEKISKNVKQLIYAVMPEKIGDYICEVGSLTNQSFYNCITGQMMECVILGSLTALGMTIFGFPYAALIGVMIAILCWIPMFGVTIGAAIGAVIILTVDPVQAIWFVVFMVCLQQIEGNFIYPKVVGNNIGLPPILLISAIILFSNFFGIIGLLVSGAFASVLYTIIKRFVSKRLLQKKLPEEKFMPETIKLESDEPKKPAGIINFKAIFNKLKKDKKQKK